MAPAASNLFSMHDEHNLKSYLEGDGGSIISVEEMESAKLFLTRDYDDELAAPGSVDIIMQPYDEDDDIMTMIRHKKRTLSISSFDLPTTTTKKNKSNDGLSSTPAGDANNYSNNNDIVVIKIPPLPKPVLRPVWRRPVCTFFNFLGSRQLSDIAPDNADDVNKNEVLLMTPSTPVLHFPICPCKLVHQVTKHTAVAPPILKLFSATSINYYCPPACPSPCSAIEEVFARQEEMKVVKEDSADETTSSSESSDEHTVASAASQ